MRLGRTGVFSLRLCPPLYCPGVFRLISGGPGLGAYRHRHRQGVADRLQRRLTSRHAHHPLRVAVPVRHDAGDRHPALRGRTKDGHVCRRGVKLAGSVTAKVTQAVTARRRAGMGRRWVGDVRRQADGTGQHPAGERTERRDGDASTGQCSRITEAADESVPGERTSNWLWNVEITWLRLRMSKSRDDPWSRWRHVNNCLVVLFSIPAHSSPTVPVPAYSGVYRRLEHVLHL